MNAPKLVTEIVVLLVAVALLYPTIDSAIPKELNGNPFDIQMDGGISTNVNSNMEVELSMPDILFSSSLPEAFKDVNATVYIGKQDSRICIGTYHADTVSPNTQERLTFNVAENLSIPYLMTYIPMMGTDTGVEIPIYLGFGFQYMEWNGTELIDLNVVMKASMPATGGSVTTVVSGTTAAVSINPGPSSEMPAALLKQVSTQYGNDIEFGLGDGTMRLQYLSDANVVFTATGADGKTVAQIAEQMLADTGKITLNYGGNPVTIDGDTAEAMISALEYMYAEEA